ncbi:MAG: signal peptidase [Thermodesulfobacteriota bacterium]|nr:signal peptidase [Thermodesulfobacteriota bacterium]
MIGPALGVVILDQISKAMITGSLRLHESMPVIQGFFNLVHVRNRGMAFGLMNRSHADAAFWLLVGASCIAIGLLVFWFIRLKESDARMTLGLSLILGGAIGNLIDRLRFREVVDFLDVFWGTYHWPAFNVADAAVTVGTFWVAVSLIFRPSSAD